MECNEIESVTQLPTAPKKELTFHLLTYISINILLSRSLAPIEYISSHISHLTHLYIFFNYIYSYHQLINSLSERDRASQPASQRERKDKRRKKMKKMNLILRKCKTLSRQLGRSSSYSSLRSNSTREAFWCTATDTDTDTAVDDKEHRETIFVGSSRRRYVVKSKFLSHPLLSALIEKSRNQNPGCDHHVISVKCEVVLFDHLLWMLENADPTNLASDSLEELADLYVF